MNWDNYALPTFSCCDVPLRNVGRFEDAMTVAKRTIRDMGMEHYQDFIIREDGSSSPMAAYAEREITMFEVVLLVRNGCLNALAERKWDMANGQVHQHAGLDVFARRGQFRDD